MVSLEKLTLFNIDDFRLLYNISYNSYICDNDFFEIYDDESFIVKYIIRKQVRLFKMDDKYIGYIWFEYPCEDNISSIYSLYIKEDYIQYINPETIEPLFVERNILKFDGVNTKPNLNIVKMFDFQVKYETLFMHARTNNYSCKDKSIKFKHFKKGKDEKLRCEIQNSVFNDRNRVPLTVNDIYSEEKEHYYIDDFGVFIYVDEKPIGYGQVILNRGKYTIVNLGILEEYRGRGYGQALLNFILNLCNERYIYDIYIRVETTNTCALSLYKKAGFSTESHITTWISQT